MKIGITGAGIGGMTAAVALQQRGFQVVVYEQATELGEVGAAITLGPNANRIFAALGLEDEVAALASATPSTGTLHWQTGERLGYVQRSVEDYLSAYGAVTRHMHRADIHGVLVRAFDAGTDSLRLDHRLTDIEQDSNEVTLHFANGQSDRCDIVVACDGIKSIARDKLFITEPPTFTGLVAWRGLVDREKIPEVNFDPHFAAFPAENKLFGRYPIRHGTLINYVAIASQPDFHEESWSAYGDVADVLAEFSDWYEDIVKIIRATPADRCLRWAMHSRQPLDSWVTGRVALLGDAAHPMTPFLGSGAVMAIEDGAVLARCFAAAGDDWADALQLYERARLPCANKVHMDSVKRGEAYLGSDPAARGQAPSVGMEEVYQYDAMSVPI
ncbi:MAG: monooxygenase [Chromatiales bacterium]|nr:monooxygenase [Chromatiales bacterium]